MNVFVLCTGRCGSTTFTKACEHITNYTAGHESRSFGETGEKATGFLGPDRFAYPDRHIEADPRLSWMLGRLDQFYGDDAFYVHLVRDEAKTANSHFARSNVGQMVAWRVLNPLVGGVQFSSYEHALDMVRNQTANIEYYLRDRPNVMRFELAKAKRDWPKFWKWIRAEGNYEAALGEFRRVHNASPNGEFAEQLAKV